MGIFGNVRKSSESHRTSSGVADRRDVFGNPGHDKQFRSGYQVRPSRLSESHAVGERYEVNNVYFEKGFIFKFPSDCKTRLKSNSTVKVRGFLRVTDPTCFDMLSRCYKAFYVSLIL